MDATALRESKAILQIEVVNDYPYTLKWGKRYHDLIVA
jgi:hypothetical protein